MTAEAVHAGLAAGRWTTLTLSAQLANVGSEVGRAVRAHAQDNPERSVAALDRALELFDLSLADERWHGRRTEICRARELVCDFLVSEGRPTSSRQTGDSARMSQQGRGPWPSRP